MSNPVLITGCAFYVPDEEKAVHGDLWHHGDCFIFNAVVHGFATAWMHRAEAKLLIAAPQRVITLIPDAEYFDRRGVVVCCKLHATLNKAAREHMAKWNPDFYLPERGFF